MKKNWRDKPCKLWTGCIVGGYGHRKHGGRVRKVHQLAWEDAYGPIPRGLCVLHRCDTPACHEPTHLFLGTKKDNYDDMVAKGRCRIGGGGEGNGSARLTWKDVEEIRSSYAAGGTTLQALGDRFGCTLQNIASVVKGRTWK